MTAQAIVNQLLEAGETSLWVFGPGLPKHGIAFGGMDNMLSTFNRYGFQIPQGPDTLGQLTREGFTIIEKTPQGGALYSQNMPRIPAETADRIMAFFGFDKGTSIVDKTKGDTTSAERVLFGTDEFERENQAKATATTAEEREKRLVHYKDRYGRPQTIDPEEEDFHPRPQPEVGQVTPSADEGVSLGFTYDSGYERTAMNEQERGVLVAAVHDGGPLAQAGVQAGDIIQTATYTDAAGAQKEYRTRTVANLAAIMAAAAPGSPMVLYVRRGGQGHEVVVEPQAAQQGLHIPAAEVQAWAGQQGQAPAAQVAPKAAPERQPQLRGWPRGRRPQRNLQFKPNAKQPAGQTGNRPANVSTLT